MIIAVGMSLRGRSVEKNILLDGNFVEASVINIKMLEEECEHHFVSRILRVQSVVLSCT